MNIGSGNTYPANALSNFAPHPFVFDGVSCASMEGFLQSLKFKNPDMQVHICTLVGYAAKKAGRKKNWQQTQELWWRGMCHSRDGREYQLLLDRAFAALGGNEGFQRALLASHHAVLRHSIGKRKTRETVLTQSEFCQRLTRLRTDLQGRFLIPGASDDLRK